MLDLRRLRLLRELKHRGTMAAVADALSYSPSAVSQQLSLLETEVGVRLLEHVGRRVRLTAEAELLVAHTEAVLDRLERARADLAASTDGVSGTVRLASFQTAALSLLPSALTLLARRHPRLRVEATEREPDSAFPGLLARDFDLILGEEYPGHPQRHALEVERQDLLQDPIRLAVPASTNGAPTATSLRELSDVAWVMEPEGSPARQWATALCRDVGFEPDVRFTSTDLLTHAQLARTGHAAALLPDLLWLPGQSRPALIDLPGTPCRRVFTAVRRGAEAHPALQAVRTSLLDAAAPPPQPA